MISYSIFNKQPKDISHFEFSIARQVKVLVACLIYSKILHQNLRHVLVLWLNKKCGNKATLQSLIYLFYDCHRSITLELRIFYEYFYYPKCFLLSSIVYLKPYDSLSIVLLVLKDCENVG